MPLPDAQPRRNRLKEDDDFDNPNHQADKTKGIQAPHQRILGLLPWVLPMKQKLSFTQTPFEVANEKSKLAVCQLGPKAAPTQAPVLASCLVTVQATLPGAARVSVGQILRRVQFMVGVGFIVGFLSLLASFLSY